MPESKPLLCFRVFFPFVFLSMVAFLAVYLFPAAFPARDLFTFSALLEMMKPVFVQVGQPMRWRLSTLVEMWSRCTRMLGGSPAFTEWMEPWSSQVQASNPAIVRYVYRNYP
ncbi:hypothetical protein MYCTH_2310561 [Thermothelomyces thermophilus ATCC 42464]|uniref:Uncharacterized protein n=1 Tax=Thermothelomyces thermophilus (strain ATCC 42464 / BCRC 31852 / DSM 1799) TaxID=573729 RepID=G2QLP1_THET4|nr:uncharacterized protein MYCTH_2310561 [Thermothelomyces thermophilus ATCC 42464]AEO60871.1 hypothetical protein MYCTH_2310561 [Thermothelomyces thermophilus ATCC 42464]